MLNLLITKVNERNFSHLMDGKREVIARIWSIAEKGLKSEEALEQTLPSVPKLMKDYVARYITT